MRIAVDLHITSRSGKRMGWTTFGAERAIARRCVQRICEVV